MSSPNVPWTARRAGQWALAFVNTLRRDPEAVGQGLALLNVIYPVIDSIHASGGRGEPSGMAAAAQLEEMFRAALRKAAADSAGSAGPAKSAGSGGGLAGGEAETVEITFRFLLLLVRRGYFGHIGKIAERIGEEMDELRGFLRAGLEAPFPPEESFKKDLEGKIAGKTGAQGVVFQVKIVPELFAGYRLRIGGEIIDASLRTLLKKMETDLAAAYIPGKSGALNGPLPSHGGL